MTNTDTWRAIGIAIKGMGDVSVTDKFYLLDTVQFASPPRNRDVVEGFYLKDTSAEDLFGAAQYSSPNVDIFDGQWLASNGGADLYAMVDESVADDADSIYTNTISSCSLGMQTLVDPGVDTGHFVHYRARGDGINHLRVRFYVGSVQLATWVNSTPAPTFTTYTQSLTTTEANSINDYSAMRLVFETLAP